MSVSIFSMNWGCQVLHFGPDHSNIFRAKRCARCSVVLFESTTVLFKIALFSLFCQRRAGGVIQKTKHDLMSPDLRCLATNLSNVVHVISSTCAFHWSSQILFLVYDFVLCRPRSFMFCLLIFCKYGAVEYMSFLCVLRVNGIQQMMYFLTSFYV